MVRLLPSKQHNLLNKIWIKLAITFSHSVGAVSLAVQRDLPKNNKVKLIYNPSLLTEKHKHTRNATSEKIRFLYLSNYIKGKGQDYAIQAVAQSLTKNPNIELHFYGSDMGLNKNKIWKNSLQDKVNELNISENIFFHDFCTNIEKEIKESDVLLNFSDSESFSQTCYEASAYGKPVIATRCGGPDEIIVDQLSGFLVPVRDTAEMASAITKLSLNKQLRDEMGNAGKLIVANKFSKNSFINAFAILTNN